jgi:hypothetical protein
MCHNHKFAAENSPAWNAAWNRAYRDCADPEKGALTAKPDNMSPMEWEAYQDGCYWFDNDSRAMANEGGK